MLTILCCSHLVITHIFVPATIGDTQLLKTRTLTLRTRKNYVADLDLFPCHHHLINEQLDEDFSMEFLLNAVIKQSSLLKKILIVAETKDDVSWIS